MVANVYLLCYNMFESLSLIDNTLELVNHLNLDEHHKIFLQTRLTEIREVVESDVKLVYSLRKDMESTSE